MSTSTSEQSQFSFCVICSGHTNGIWHYGVECCRACASFFHRSMTERRQYGCRKEQNCIISNEDGLRNSCRACRFKKCVEVGMVLTERKRTTNNTEKDEDNQPLPFINEGTDASSSVFPNFLSKQFLPGSSSSISSDSIDIDTSVNTSTLMKSSSSSIPETMHLLTSLRKFNHGIRAFSIVEGLMSDMAGAQNKFKLLTGDEYKKYDKGMSILASVMIVEYMPEVNRFPRETKFKFFKYFGKQFMFFKRCQMTDEVFPANPTTPPYAVVIPGGVIDRTKMEMLLKVYLGNATVSPEYQEKYHRCFIERHFEIAKEIYPRLKITNREFTALTGLLFWHSVEYVANDFVPSNVCAAKRNALYAELRQIILEEFKQKQQKQQQQLQNEYSHAMERIADEKEIAVKVAIRVGKLMHFLHQLTILAWEVKEVLAMGKIFMNIPDPWDEIMESSFHE